MAQRSGERVSQAWGEKITVELSYSIFSCGNHDCPKLYSSEPWWATYTQWIFKRHRFPLSLVLAERSRCIPSYPPGHERARNVTFARLFKTGQPLVVASSKIVVETAGVGRHARQSELPSHTQQDR
jgi:hypothetical protein